MKNEHLRCTLFCSIFKQKHNLTKNGKNKRIKYDDGDKMLGWKRKKQLRKQVEELNKKIEDAKLKEYVELMGNTKKLLWKNFYLCNHTKF